MGDQVAVAVMIDPAGLAGEPGVVQREAEALRYGLGDAAVVPV